MIVSGLLALTQAGSPDPQADAATLALPAEFSDSLVASVVAPTALAFTPDATMLVSTQQGQLRVFSGGTARGTALDLGPRLCSDNERGLLGIAIDPDFAVTRHVYLYYTFRKFGSCATNSASSPVNRVSRFTLPPSNVIDPGSELVLLDGIPSPAGNHNAGDLQFGKDGYLYVSVGDGGCDYAGDSGCAGANDAARDRHVLVGKILRIARDGSIPASNPFVSAENEPCSPAGSIAAGLTCEETFAWGLRNPFRMAFDPNPPTTRFFINDVGQNQWEEIDLGTAGADYGWNVREGFCERASETRCGGQPPGMTNPIHAYGRDTGCRSITGGAFVPGGVWPASFDGAYLFADYVCGAIFRLVPNGAGGYTQATFATGLGGGSAVHLGFGPDAGATSLYYTTYADGGQVRKIAYTGPSNRVPVAAVSASPTTGAVPLVVGFDGAASADPDGDPLTYLWSFGDGQTAETQSAAISHTYESAGSFAASLRVRDGSGAVSAAASVRVDAGNEPPVPEIVAPTADYRFGVDEPIALRGRATDPEEGSLSSSRLSWKVTRVHDTHTHPYVPPTSAAELTIPGAAPEDLLGATNSHLVVELTATDSTGLSRTVSRELRPALVDVTITTEPLGLTVDVNGTTITGPTTFTSWRGYELDVAAPAQTDEQGGGWRFQTWSDGGDAAHQIVTPATAATYTVTFRPGAPPQTGLVAAFGFEEGSGSIVLDASGFGNAGAVSGAVWGPGRHGGGLVFDGVNDWVSVPDHGSLDVSTGLTLSAWVRPSGGSSWRTVVLKERSGGLVYGLYERTGSRGPSGHVQIGGGEPRARASGVLPAGAWSHVASTFDGAAVRVFVNGVQVASAAAPGAVGVSAGALRLGGNAVWSEWFAGTLDDVRVYSRALSVGEIQTDMSTPAEQQEQSADTNPPGSPTGLTATTSVDSVTLGWEASTDDRGVVGYNVHRSTTPGFAPSAANLVAEPASTSYTDTDLAPGDYYYKVTAEDAARNVGAASNEAAAQVRDVTPPRVQIVEPQQGDSVAGTLVISADASDDVSVAQVQFELDGAPLGAPDTSPPYSITLDTTSYADGTTLALRALARDDAANAAASSTAVVTVANQRGLVAAFGFGEGSGSAVEDSSGFGNAGVVSGAAWGAGRHGGGLVFDGVNDWVSVADHGSLDVSTGLTLSAWVRPTGGSSWWTLVLKERPGGLAYGLYGQTGARGPSGHVRIGDGEPRARASGRIASGVWSHVASTFDGSTVRVFVNGVEASRATAAGVVVSSSGPLRLGGNGVWSEWFAGTLDDVRVYSRPLTPAQIQADMQTPVD